MRNLFDINARSKWHGAMHGVPLEVIKRVVRLLFVNALRHQIGDFANTVLRRHTKLEWWRALSPINLNPLVVQG